METTESIIERLRKLTKTKSDYAVARLLGCTQSTLINWKSGKTSMANAYAVKAAELLEMDPMQVIAWIELERNPLSKHQEMWQRYSGRLLPAIATAAVIGFAGVQEDTVAAFNNEDVNRHTSDYAHTPDSDSLDIYYAQLVWQRVASAFGKAFSVIRKLLNFGDRGMVYAVAG